MDLAVENGIVSLRSRYSVDETVSRFQALFQGRKIKLFATVDHSGEAAKVDLQMPPTKLLIFGNPKAGTPAMLAAPSLALDLPLKVLVWSDAANAVWISYNSPGYLQTRHGVPPELVANISAVEGLAKEAAGDSAKS